MTNTQKDYQVLARRYRPQIFSEVLGQEAIVTTLKNGIKNNRLAHAYLFCGSRGTGKTTLARVFAKGLNCHNRNAECEPCNTCSSCKEIAASSSLDVLEIDGASHRGIDDVRQINDTVAYAPSGGRYKVYIIDEVHMLTKEAFNALLKTLEEPPEKVKFFFATTEPHKVPATILSRCQRFNLNRIPTDKLTNKLRFMAKEQNASIEDEALSLIAQRADGGFRDAESLLDQILAFCDGAITAQSVAEVLGIVPRDLFFKLDDAGKQGDLAFAFEVGNRIFAEGKDLFHFVELLTDHFRTILLLKLTGKDSQLADLSPGERERYEPSLKVYTQEQCLTIIDFLIEAQSKIRFMPSPRVAVEALLLRILRIHQRIPIDYLVHRLSELERMLHSTGSEKAPIAPIENFSTAPLKPLIQNKSLIEDPTPSARDLGIQTKPTPPSEPTSLPPSAAEATASTKPVAVESPSHSALQQQALPSLATQPMQQDMFLAKQTLAPPPFIPQEPQPKPLVPTPPQPSIPPPSPAIPPPMTADEQKEAKKRQSRYDTILQFAAIELEGSLQKKPMRGY